MSITLPAAQVTRIKERVGPRGFSAYVWEVLEREARREALLEWLAEIERQHGPIPDEVLERVRKEWPAAGAVL